MRSRQRRGFSLAEVLAVMFCFGLLAAAVSQIFVVTQRTSRKVSAQSDTRVAVRTLFQAMTSDIRAARYAFGGDVLRGRLGGDREIQLIVGGEARNISAFQDGIDEMQVLVLVLPESSAVRPEWQVVVYHLSDELFTGLNGEARHKIVRFTQRNIPPNPSGLPSDIDLDSFVGDQKSYECMVPDDGFRVNVSDSSEGVLVELLTDVTGEDGTRVEHFQTYVTVRNAI